jgi:tetratricopeptide (TPR) repeat protein
VANKQWEEAKSEMDAVKDLEDPEYYTLLLNYYFGKSYMEDTTSQSGYEGEDGEMYYDSSEVYPPAGPEYDMALLNEGLEQFKPALTKFPSRIDFKLGYAFVMIETYNYSETENILNDILDVSAANGNNWLGQYNKPIDSSFAKDFMLDNVQYYVGLMFESEDPSADSAVYRLGVKMAEMYPESIYGYFYAGSVCVMQGNDAQALPYFLKAYKIAPDNLVVTSNLAEIYLMLENYSTAMVYLKKVAASDNEQYKAWAEGAIKAIKDAQSQELE